MSAPGDTDELTQSLAFNTSASDAPRLLVLWEGGFAARALKPGKSLLVGRAQESDVHVLHPSVSRRHVAVHAGPPFTVEDLGSANGTFVDGVRLPARSPVSLEPGKVVEAGGAIVMVHAPSGAGAQQLGAPVAPVETPAPLTMARVRRLIELVGASGLSVIFQGETGVGKDVLAREIHARSPRSGGPFVRVNCALIPESQLEAELFGADEPGLLEAASGGSCLLDQIPDLPAALQSKLLHVLETREVRRLSSGAPRAIDVRFIAATQRDLRPLLETGAFRSDLYYRLNGIQIRVPPLRERRGEIESLSHALLAEACARAGRSTPAISRAALQALEQHAFPGNVRELENVIERAALLCEKNEITPEHLLFDPGGGSGVPRAVDLKLDQEVADYERRRILDALERTHGNQTRAAELLGLTRRALIGRLETHGLPRPRKDRRTS